LATNKQTNKQTNKHTLLKKNLPHSLRFAARVVIKFTEAIFYGYGYG